MSFVSSARSWRVRAVATLCVSLLAAPGARAQSAPSSTLEPVVVTASRTPQPLATVLADVSVLERADIERAGATGLADLLARLPGVEFARNGGPGTSTSLFVRGSDSRHTAVYLDGVRIDSQSTGGAAWELIPLDQIDRIELLRGPAAAVYGSDAITGVVQLFTRRGSGPLRGSVALGAGSQGLVQAQAGLSGSAEALDYALSASHGRSAGFDATGPGAYGHHPDRDGWRRDSLQGRLGLQIDPRHRLDASVLASRLLSDYDGSATTDDQNHHTLRSGQLRWQAQWSGSASTQLQLGETRATYETRPSVYRTETTLRDLSLLHEQRLDTQVLTFTLDHRGDELRNPATDFEAAFGGRRHQDGAGLGWRATLGAHELQAHLRHDEDSEFGARPTGSLAWGWNLQPAWRVSASAGSAFRAPTLYQRYSQYGNPALVPETGRNLELGLRWAGAGDEAGLTVWRNTVSHLIEFGAAGPCASEFGCYENIGRARLSGLTLAGRTSLGALALRGSLDWHDPRNRDTGLLLPRRARRLANLGAETRLAGWSLGAEWQAASRRQDNAANTAPLGGYALLNLLAGTTLAPGLVLEARLDNLADKRYELARNYRSAGRTAQAALRWSL